MTPLLKTIIMNSEQLIFIWKGQQVVLALFGSIYTCQVVLNKFAHNKYLMIDDKPSMCAFLI